ncbi:hypothetical protein N0V90_011664 [Kalmusia sp. IMI 367209]|nr:hypothetical protein N0V90_011664 [Kalmusia sp. IMI 367209]
MVNFTFVSHKGARPEKSELVKSHVMRESQKKRREAKQRHRHDISPSCEQLPTPLEDPATALADETIMAVMGMAMYENLRGSDLAITHERGLRQMFDMRGGIENFMSEKGFYIGNFALLADMMHSSCSNKPPLFLEVKSPVLRDIHVGIRKPFFPHSPLRVVNHPGFTASVSIPELRFSLDMLRDAFDGFEMLCVEVFDAETASREAPQLRVRREKYWARLQAQDSSTSETIPPTTEGKVQEAIRVAGTIHFCAVVSRIQHDDELNTPNAQRLHDVLKKLRLDFWKTAPYLYLWMYVTW